MKRSTIQPDLTPLLEQLLKRAGAPGAGSSNSRAIPVERQPQQAWPQFDAAASEFAAVYQKRSDALGSFKRIGRASQTPEGWIETTAKPSEFQGWLPFASKRLLELKGAFFEAEIEVETGVVVIAILSEDGSNFVGDRYVAPPGHHLLQIPILSNEVIGAVFCNGEEVDATSRFRIDSAAVRQLDPGSSAAQQLNQSLAQEQSSPQAETAAPHLIAANPTFVLYRLLSQGEYHAARSLYCAARTLNDQSFFHFPPRFTELLAQFNGMEVANDAPAPDAATAWAPQVESAFPAQLALNELTTLRASFIGNPLVPLHLEILEFGFSVELVGRVKNQLVKVSWSREAVASTLVPRGLLRNLLNVISERLQGDISGITVDISTNRDGTSLAIQSQLQNGDLQYRDFSSGVAALHEAINDPRVPLPHLVHHLGGENQLELRWPGSASTCDLANIEWGNAIPGTESDLYDSELGGHIRLANGLCYKIAPRPSSKPNDLVEEATLLQKLAGSGFVPTIGAAHAWPDCTAMSYRFVDGVTLAQWNTENRPTRGERVHVLQQLSDAISELNRQGIQHRDLRAENILIKSDRSLVILDFDQARADVGADDFGNEWDADDVCAGFGGLIRQLGWERIYLETAGSLGLAWELGRTSAANSPGNHSCYYAWQWGALSLRGERPWTLRWKLLQTALPSTPGTFLELGCNLGLLSNYAALAGWQSSGLDHDGVAVAAADQIASALHTSAQFQTADLTSPSVFESLDQTYEMVSALSVVHWLPDPKPVEAFLSRQPRLLFEGHRTLAEEETYLQGLGFSDIQLLGYSERLRPVILATRTTDLA